MKLRTFSYDISDYVFIKELSGYFYNGHLVFDATSVLKTDSDMTNYFSLFMIFGYENGTNYTKDISFLFSDSDNSNPNTATQSKIQKINANMMTTLQNSIISY
jgi:hypothetical protein